MAYNEGFPSPEETEVIAEEVKPTEFAAAPSAEVPVTPEVVEQEEKSSE